MGKDISGAGMDTNIIAAASTAGRSRRAAPTSAPIWVPQPDAGSHGNAIGIGLADVASKSLVDRIDPDSIFVNALSSMTPGTAKTPMYFPTDRECLKAAVRFSGSDAEHRRHRPHQEHAGARSLRRLGDYRDEIAGRSDLRIVSEPGR